MIYLKSYCYSKHELPFIISNLIEGFEFIDYLVLYEYNYTHCGCSKNYELESILHLIPEELQSKLIYKKIDLTNVIEYAYNDEDLIHKINEPIMRSYFFNDDSIHLNDNDIIIDHDIDEIIYKDCYLKLINELSIKNKPLSIKLNQFFYKQNYLWTDCKFSSPSIYKYCMVKNINTNIKGLYIKHNRDLIDKTNNIYGAHMSWIMSPEYMIKKLHSYSHPKYRKYADINILNNAIINKQYIFDLNRAFNIDELNIDDIRIPIYLQTNNIFEYL